MAKDPRMSPQTLSVLKMFTDSPREEFAGADIAQRIKIGAGTLYPILMRLEDASWLKSRWEDIDPSREGRPRRRYYQLTALGHKKAIEALNKKMGEISEEGLAWT